MTISSFGHSRSVCLCNPYCDSMMTERSPPTKSLHQSQLFSSSYNHRQVSRRSWTVGSWVFLALRRWDMPSHNARVFLSWRLMNTPNFNPVLKCCVLIPGATVPADTDELPYWKRGSLCTCRFCKSFNWASALGSRITARAGKLMFTVCFQLMGTEVPCTDRNPSPATPTSGKIYILVHTVRTKH